ncbi:hypothetical protein PVAP13_7NG097585 [Panicum virgatum]|uniref:NB-ARC domain-containing protein n=1 Tax=Panicum virgatum TaxID=38727 RepID=A0A8T0PTK1_PANVG|nr:hypothetical protein PVAP13_7NG097585 [Panicum virgatum]
MGVDDLNGVFNVKRAVEKIIPYLEDTGRTAHKAIYFDGRDGLAASAVRTVIAIAEDPPPSLKEKFTKILHIDCSRWKSRRALQRAIADELELPQRVMAAFDREDEEDDFSIVDEGILESLLGSRYLVVFRNGSNDTVDLVSCGIPQPGFFGSKILWTFRGRLRLNPEIKEKSFDGDTAQLILDEATEIVKYIQHNHNITPRIAAKCISYLLWFNKMGGGTTMEYNWGTHAYNYWVCDGIIEGGQFDESWEVSAALHHQIRLEDCLFHTVNFRDDQYTEHWKSVVNTSDIEARTDITVSPTLTSFFLTQSERLRVLKLSGCNFSFYSPPFHCCRSHRFVGLDSCKDQGHQEKEKQGKPIMEFFQSLCVLDISHTDWELDLSQDIMEQMAVNIREVHIKKGRFWCSNLAWRQLQNLRKLCVIEPTSPWETGKRDEFMDMVKLELLDLSGNKAIQVLPSLCGATGLKTLILDGCAGLEHVGLEGLPPSLESFSLDAGAGGMIRSAVLEGPRNPGRWPVLRKPPKLHVREDSRLHAVALDAVPASAF